MLDYLARVDLTSGKVSYEQVNPELIKECMGGVSLSAYYLINEVKPGVEWNSESNKLYFMTGPMGGTKLAGTGIINVLSKGPMTNLAGSSQANGFFGAFLRLNGLIGIVVEGISPKWAYLWVQNGKVSIMDGENLVGLDTEQVCNHLSKNNKGISVASIGIAGENLVRFAGIVCDYGHIAAHNGLGAVMGSKKLKAIGIVKGKNDVTIQDTEALLKIGRQIKAEMKEGREGIIVKWGTAGLYENNYLSGTLPVKNYLTNLWPHYQKFTGQELRKSYKGKVKPCWTCGLHCRWINVPGLGWIDEPEYEGVAAMSSLIDNQSVKAMLYLTNLIDRLGLDVNEAGWVIAWIMECYTNGIITKEMIDGLTMEWGNTESTSILLEKIAKREGCGEWLAEGVMRASDYLGQPSAKSAAIGTKKGATPRTHDHRGRWEELLDTCLSTTSTIEATGGYMDLQEVGIKPINIDRFSAKDVARYNAMKNGWRIFEDSCPICRFVSGRLTLLTKAVKAVTGWEITNNYALTIGKRTVNRLRVFNLLHGSNPKDELPSPRYGSVVIDGPCMGANVNSVYKEMQQVYWDEMGWDIHSGKPSIITLRKLNLEKEINLLYPD